MDRDTAKDLLKKHLSQENLLKHCYAVEVSMKKFANIFDKNEKKWALAGLLHDIDYEYTKNKPEEHGKKGVKIIKEFEKDIDPKILQAIKAHSGNFKRESLMDKVLYAVDPLTGLIVASSLMHPEKDITKMNHDFVLRRFNEKNFAKGANRDIIRTCEDFMELDDFVFHTLKAMQDINKTLGL